MNRVSYFMLIKYVYRYTVSVPRHAVQMESGSFLSNYRNSRLRNLFTLPLRSTHSLTQGATDSLSGGKGAEA